MLRPKFPQFSFAVAGAIVLAAAAAHGAAVIYEPFDDNESSLDGNTPGTGLSGTWESDAFGEVSGGSLSYGALPTSGNRLVLTVQVTVDGQIPR